MYRTKFLILIMAFSAMTYFAGAYSSSLIAREERFEGGGGREGGGAYHPGQQGAEHGYSDQGHSYSEQDRAMGAYGAGAMRGENNENNENGNNVQYVPYQQQQQYAPPPAQPYPYTEQPYQQ